MGKSGSASCFKFVGCGDNDAVDRDDLAGAPREMKDSNDKRKWSFRKRSASYRVLSNNVVSETSLGNKENLDAAATVNLQKQATSTNEDSKLSEIIPTTEEKSAVDVSPDELTVIMIQTAIRGFLAQRMLVKQKNIVKLQAAIRGHAVRKLAVGSLLCVQAIVKMQALVRERRARLLLEGLRTDGNDEKGVEHLESKPLVTYTSIEKLLSNRFARQLLESKPRSKAINIKCEPLKSDSAWKWLERWMSVYSVGSDNSPTFEYVTENLDEKGFEKSEYPLNSVASSGDTFLSRETTQSSTETSAVPSEGDASISMHKIHSFESNADDSTLSSLNNHLEKSCSEATCKENYCQDTCDSHPNDTTEPDFASKVDLDSLTNESEIGKQHIDSVNKSCSEESETNGKKILFGSRKASNPAFIAAQSKFEELSLAVNSTPAIGLPFQDTSSKLSSTAVSTVTNVRTTESAPAEASLLPACEFEVVGNESGTELSISSTLDSLDELGIGGPDVEMATAVSEDKDHYQKNHMKSDGDAEVRVSASTVEKEAAALDDKDEYEKHNVKPSSDAEVDSPISQGDMSCSKSVHEERRENLAEGKHDSAATHADSLQADTKPETENSGESQTDLSHQPSISSPEVSPRRLVVVPDSQETPASETSVKHKKSSRKSVPDQKHKSASSGKEYASDSNHDDGELNNSEQLPKDNKSGKRRNSFGSARPEHGNPEPRDSSSSNFLPSYMQPTESAKAKAIANNSPRSSPDLSDKDFHIKKRHSLPGSITKQGSPRSQQSRSQALQDAKANGVHSPQERKWRR